MPKKTLNDRVEEIKLRVDCLSDMFISMEVKTIFKVAAGIIYILLLTAILIIYLRIRQLIPYVKYNLDELLVTKQRVERIDEIYYAEINDLRQIIRDTNYLEKLESNAAKQLNK